MQIHWSNRLWVIHISSSSNPLALQMEGVVGRKDGCAPQLTDGRRKNKSIWDVCRALANTKIYVADNAPYICL